MGRKLEYIKSVGKVAATLVPYVGEWLATREVPKDESKTRKLLVGGFGTGRLGLLISKLFGIDPAIYAYLGLTILEGLITGSDEYNKLAGVKQTSLSDFDYKGR